MQQIVIFEIHMEQAIKILKPLKRMPFTLAVFMRLLVLVPILGMSILMIVTGYREMQQAEHNTFGWEFNK